MRALVFDLDGTLIDSLGDIADALNEVLQSLGLPTRPADSVRTMIGHGVGKLLERGLGPHRPELLEEARLRFRDAYGARLLVRTRPYDGILEVLPKLAGAGVPLAIATNKPAFFTRPIVEGLGLLSAGIRGVASADEVHARKPDPAVVALALERAGVQSGFEGAVYVGDMPVDRDTALAAGIPLAGVAWGLDPEGLRQARPELWIETPADLLTLLGR